MNLSVQATTAVAYNSVATLKMCCSSTTNDGKKECCPRAPANRKLKATKSVSFSDDDEVHPVKRRAHLKNKEMEAIWYSENDYDAIQKEAKRTVRAMRANATHNIDCSRGFENIRTEDLLVLTESQKSAAIRNVLEAQQNGACATELRNISLRHTKEAKARALVLGTNDAYDVERIPYVVKEVPDLVKKNKSKKSLLQRLAPKTRKQSHKNTVVIVSQAA